MRQLTDSTGAVTFARTYDPYGVVTTSTGPSSSGYGFTGEYQQGDLVYLRARHYAPGMGRFLTRDTWPGEVNRPLSLNRWGYVEANPVNFVDPTGLFITKADITNGVAVYSCNCGWIEFAHGNPSLAIGIYQKVKKVQELNPPPDTFLLKYRRDVLVIDVSQPVKRKIPGTPIYIENLGFHANVVNSLEKNQEWEVTLSLLMRLSEMREWASIVGGGDSHFSEEDLVSDMIGFYLAYNGYGDARSDNAAWYWLAQKCGFSTSREIARDHSEDIFVGYKSTPVKEWHKPRLFSNPDIEKYFCENDWCTGERKWPTEFQSVSPDKSNWSFYFPFSQRSMLLPTGHEGVYYSGYSTWR